MATIPLEASRVSLAIKILRHRRRLGLTQMELARRAGIRPETLNRIERGESSPSVRTVEKIDRALTKAEAGPAPARKGSRRPAGLTRRGGS